MTSLTFPEAYRRYVRAFGASTLRDYAAVGVKFVPHGAAPPVQAAPLEKAYTWCTAVREASRGRVPLVTRDTVGCVMAAIALGLVDENESEPLPGWRQYSQNMSSQPSPLDYKEGRVLACRAAGHQEFAMCGADDPGRFQSVEAAKRAFGDMAKIQPPTMDAVVALPPVDEVADVEPDVVILALTPRETVRTLQALTFQTGERIEVSTLGVAGFCVDLSVQPYRTGKVNASFLCVGARVIARWEGNLNGLGIPWKTFHSIVDGMEASRVGYPFERYPD